MRSYLRLPALLLAFSISLTAVAPLAAEDASSQLFEGSILLRQTAPKSCPDNVKNQKIAFYLQRKGSRAKVEYIDGTKLYGASKAGAVMAMARRNQNVKDIIRLKGLDQGPVRARIQIIWDDGDQKCSYIYTGSMKNVTVE